MAFLSAAAEDVSADFRPSSKSILKYIFYQIIFKLLYEDFNLLKNFDGNVN